MTGANFLVETDGSGSMGGARILVDCGLVQGESVAAAENREPFPYDPGSVAALIVTHAHLDHVGRIPKLVKEGFRGTICSTPETRELAELVLRDAVGILEIEARREGVLPLYEPADVDAVFPLWKTWPYHESFLVAPGVHATFKDAGHILGSAMTEVSLEGKGIGSHPDLKILFTGDLGNSPAPLLCDTEPAGDVDYMVMESVYGDRNHGSREDRERELERIVTDALARGGTLVIPAFSIDRTQVLLYELNRMVERGRIPSVPVFVDSPLAIKATEAYRRSEKLFNEKVRQEIAAGDDPFAFPRLEYTVSQNESRDIERMKGAKIILAGSGMSMGGRVVSHEEHYLPDPKNTILLVGYQTAGSIGRQLADGAKKVRIHDRTVHVKAKVETLYGFSAHKDSDRLVGFVSTAGRRLARVFVAMGEPGSSMHLAQRLNSELGVQALVPERKRAYEL